MIDTRIESVILKNLVYNEQYLRKVLPFIKEEYFESSAERHIFKSAKLFVDKFNKLPSIEALVIVTKASKKLQEKQVQDVLELLGTIKKGKEDKSAEEWLLEQTEKFCQNMAVHNALTLSIAIDSGDVKDMDKGMIPKILQDAISVCFDDQIGHDWKENVEERFEYYHRKEHHVPFDISFLNKITNGGFTPKTLNVIMAGTGVGKSLIMCHMATSMHLAGKNVLYITLEMAAEEISKRIDANILNVPMDRLSDLTKEAYMKKVNEPRNRALGRLIVKDYGTGTAHVGHFRHLMNELYLKKNFKPDIIFVDYLNICASTRLKASASVNSYTLVKSIAEELRGFAFEFNVPVVSATQSNRSGAASTDPELQDTAESFGLPATADFFCVAIRTEKLDALNQIMFKQLKNRYTDQSMNKRFVVGCDRMKMRLYDVEQSAQEDIMDSGQSEGQEKLAISKKFGSQAYKPAYPQASGKFSKDKFSGFKMKSDVSDEDVPW